MVICYALRLFQAVLCDLVRCAAERCGLVLCAVVLFGVLGGGVGWYGRLSRRVVSSGSLETRFLWLCLRVCRGVSHFRVCRQLPLGDFGRHFQVRREVPLSTFTSWPDWFHSTTPHSAPRHYKAPHHINTTLQSTPSQPTSPHTIPRKALSNTRRDPTARRFAQQLTTPHRARRFEYSLRA